MQKITIKLSRYVWEQLSDILGIIAHNIQTVDKGEMIMALVMQELYISKYTFFSFWKPNKKKQMNLTLTPVQALALHSICCENDNYNIHLRQSIEPFIINYLP